MCYGKQKMVICFKTTENFGARWLIIFQASGSFATRVDKLLSLSFKCVLSMN